MVYYNPLFSYKDYYKDGSSLWRWVKYGHGKSTPYIDPFSEKSLTTPCAPLVQNRIKILMSEPQKLPAIFRERAENFIKALENFPVNPDGSRNYPGDGYVFFMDRCFFGNHCPSHTNPVVCNFYNYLYSYRCHMPPSLIDFFISLKEHIEKIQLFYANRFLIFKNISFYDELRKYENSGNYQLIIELLILSRMFGHPLNRYVAEPGMSSSRLLSCVYTLLDSFTFAAAKLILCNQNATRQSIMNSVNLVRETRSLINRRLPRKFVSIAALQAFHDQAAEELLKKAMEKMANLYRECKWNQNLVQLVDSVCEGEWYIPVKPIELIDRGKEHRNCIKSYYARHFKGPVRDTDKAGPHKTLIIFSKEAEAELQLKFEKKTEENKAQNETIIKIKCSSCRLIQCTTKYNKAYPRDIPERLCTEFIGRDIEIFSPSYRLNQAALEPTPR